MSWNKEDRNRLAEIWKQMLELANEATDLIRVNGGRMDFERAKAYWLGHILAGLGHENYMDRNNFRAYLEGEVGYDADNDSFEDDLEEDEDFCEEDSDETPEVITTE